MLKLDNISKSFQNHLVLDHFSMEVDEGEMIAIFGKSGSGKSTLLNIIGLIDDYDSGSYTLFGKAVPKSNTKKSQDIIRDNFSYLFQNFALVEYESVEYNLNLALKYVKKNKAEKAKIISEALEKVNLYGYEKKIVYELSGGEQQRVAVARAIIKPSKLILADEPTGSLDTENRDIIIDLLKDAQKNGKTIILVTHDQDILNQCSRTVVLK